MKYKFLIACLASLAFTGCAADSASDNLPPSLTLDVSPQLEYRVGEGVIRITLTAEDPEGGAVDLEVVSGPDRADFQSQGGWGVFTWDPLPQDVTVTNEVTTVVFAATDQRGATTEKSVSVIVLAGNGVPRFTNSTSVLHNVASGNLISFDVTVRDDDSPSVAIRMPEGFAPAGSELTKTGDMTARFGWQLTPEQIQQRVHTVKFVADDGQNSPVEQDVTIILKKDSSVGGDDQTRSGCAFEDAVSYTPLDAQRTTQNFVVEAALTAFGARFERLVVNYTTDDAYNGSDAVWETLDMMPSGDNFVAAIPNPLLENDQSREYYFEICAIDEDPGAEEEPILCGPSSLYESFIAYSPGSSECIDDPYTFYDNFGSARGLVTGEWERMRLCGDKPDVFEIGLGSQQEVEIFITYPAGSIPKIEVFDENQNSLGTPDVSDCSGYAFIGLRNDGGPTKRYVRVAPSADANDIPYQLIADVYDLTPDTACADAANEPNDTTDEATVVSSQSAQFNGLEICRANDYDLYAINAEVGQKITATTTFTHSIGDLDMRLYRPTQKEAADMRGQAADYSLGVDDDETVEWVVQEAGTHWVAVYTADSPNRYTMTVNVEAAPMCVDDDAFEPNDAQANAKYIADDTTESLQLCANGTDWYSFPVIDWMIESFIIDVEASTGRLGDLTVEVWDLFGVVGTAQLKDGKLNLDYKPLDNGNHWIVVRGAGEVTYSLTLTSLFQI